MVIYEYEYYELIKFFLYVKNYFVEKLFFEKGKN